MMKVKKIIFKLSIIFYTFVLFAALSHAKTLPLDDFIKHDDYLDAKISPDGKHLAALVRQGDIVVVVFINIKTKKIVGGIRPRKKDSIHDVIWVDNERVVFEYAKKKYSLDQPQDASELYATNIDGTQSEILFGFSASDEELGSRISSRKDTTASYDIISLLEYDDKHILIIEYPWSKKGLWLRDLRNKPSIISKLNVYTGRKTKIETLPYNGAQAIADKQGNVPFIAWEDESSNFHVAYRKDKTSPWVTLDKLLKADKDFNPVSVSNDGQKAYLLGDMGENQLRTVYELDLNRQTLTPLFKDIDANIEDWFTDPESNEPVIGVSYPSKHQHHYRNDKGFSLVHKQLTRAFKGQQVYITSRTWDGKQFIIRVSSDTNPGEYYLYNMETKGADFLLANRSWLDPRTLSNTQPIAFKARDGLPLTGYLTLPRKKIEGNYPLIVLPHGGPHGVREYWNYNNETQLFASQGYAVLTVNFRGSGGFGRKFIHAGYRQWGGEMIDDIIDATQFAIKNGKVDGQRVCVYGASYGGYAALMSVAKASALFKCAIGAVGIYDLNLMYEEGDIPEFWMGEGYLEKVIGRDAKELFDYSPVNFAKNIQSPVLLLHGERDRRAPPIHTEKMVEALKKAGKPVKHVYFNNAGHGTWSLKNRRKEYTAIFDFLDENLSPK